MRKYVIVLLIAALAAATLFACNDGGEELAGEIIVGSEDDGAQVGMSYVQFSGGKQAENVNAKTLVIKPTQNGAQAQLTFVLGSQVSGMDEATADFVPEYKAYMTDVPRRFVLEFANLAFWDYYRQFSMTYDNVFYDVFKQLDSNTNTFRIVFQMKENCDVKLKESKSQLLINFTRAEETAGSRYYVMTDSIASFNDGSVKYTDGYFPTLCSDLDNTVLISKPFEQEEAAQTFLSNTAGLLNYADMYVITLNGNSLPAYSQASGLVDVFTKKIVSMNGAPTSLPVVMADGMYLCMSSDGNTALFSKEYYDESSDISTETLWVMDSVGKLKQLSEIEFANIAKAEFSPDGKKLGLIERTADTSYLYIYNLETNVLTNLSEEGLGLTTSSFIWDSLGTSLYAISGNDSQKLLKYDFMIPDESARISVVEESEMTEGDLGFYNGEVYYTNIDDKDVEMIYKIKPEGGLRVEFAKGGTFVISPDGKYMAMLNSETVNVDDTDEGTKNTSTLTIKNMATGAEQAIVDGPYILSYAWTADGRLFYTEAKSDELNEDYSFALKYYDVSSAASTLICDLASSEFFTTTNPSVLYIPYVSDLSQDGLHVKATYELKLS